MTLQIILTCSGRPHPSNGCPEGHSFRREVDDSHGALKDAYADMMKDADAAGWKRSSKDLKLRCGPCAEAVETGPPTEIAGIAWDKWAEAIRRTVNGEKPSSWAGKNGLPTTAQWNNARQRYPQIIEPIRAAETYKPARPPSLPVSEERWAEAITRFAAGEMKVAICTGLDGWPSGAQWNVHMNADQTFREAINYIYEQRRNRIDWDAALARFEGGESVSRFAGEPFMPTLNMWQNRRNQDPDFRERVDIAREAFVRAKAVRSGQGSARARAEQVDRPRRGNGEIGRMHPSREKQQREMDEWRAEQAARKTAKAEERARLAAEADARKAEMREANKRIRERKAAEKAGAEKQAKLARRIEREKLRAEAAADKARRAEIEKFQRARRPRIKQDWRPRNKPKTPPNILFARRLAPPDAEGCRHWVGPVPHSVKVADGRSMRPEHAALYFAGKPVPKGCVVDHNCWNDTCFAVEHLTVVAKEIHVKTPEMVPDDMMAAATAVLCTHFRLPAGLLVDSRDKRPHVAFARQVLIYLLIVDFEFSQPVVGLSLKRDRTTISHSVRQIEDRRDDPAIDAMLDDLSDRIRNQLEEQKEAAP